MIKETKKRKPITLQKTSKIRGQIFNHPDDNDTFLIATDVAFISRLIDKDFCPDIKNTYEEYDIEVTVKIRSTKKNLN